MLLKKNYPLQNLNTFKIAAKAKAFVELKSLDDFKTLYEKKYFGYKNVFFIGGGSNVLFVDDFDGLLVKLSNKGVELLKDEPDFVLVEAQAGEIWDDFVEYCVGNNWGGLENLSLIPGQVGASPVQNIGAYGVELKDVFYSLKAMNVFSGEVLEFYSNDCKFGYRDSIFKKEKKGNFIIISVVFKLNKLPHNLNLNYGRLKEEMEKHNISSPTIMDVRKIVCDVRSNKLPDVESIGSAGSFFKNPYVSSGKYQQLIEKFPDIVAFKEEGNYKLAAGWLIDKAGWKAFRIGDAGVYKNQALVIVNYGNATGKEILCLVEKIKNSVKEKFEVTIEPEVNIIGSK